MQTDALEACLPHHLHYPRAEPVRRVAGARWLAENQVVLLIVSAE